MVVFLQFVKYFFKVLTTDNKRVWKKYIQKSKWYIILLIIEAILTPLKIVVLALICSTKRGRRGFINFCNEVKEKRKMEED